MSDNARQSFTDKATSALKPDSQKSTTEQATDRVKGAADSVASTLQPNSQKSSGQQVGDSVTSNSNESDESMLDKAKNAMGLGGK